MRNEKVGAPQAKPFVKIRAVKAATREAVEPHYESKIAEN